MEEVATCSCGCQEWTIYTNRVTCKECHQEYMLDVLDYVVRKINCDTSIIRASDKLR